MGNNVTISGEWIAKDYISGQWNVTWLRFDTPLNAQWAFVRGDFMADRTIVPMDSWTSWLAGIATCIRDYLYRTDLLFSTLLNIDTWSSETDYACTGGTGYVMWAHILTHFEWVLLWGSWDSGFVQFHLRPYSLIQRFWVAIHIGPISTLAKGSSSVNFLSRHFWVFHDTLRLLRFFNLIFRPCNHVWLHFPIRPRVVLNSSRPL